MKIWHTALIKSLPDQLLKAQHRDCCAIRGKVWGRSKSPKLRWVWNYPVSAIELFHLIVLDEMQSRGWKTTELWRKSGYRGRKAKAIPSNWILIPNDWPESCMFVEHNSVYLASDIQTLKDWIPKHKLSDTEKVRIAASRLF